MASYAKNLNAYKEQSINTMTGIEILTTIYNQLIKNLNLSKICIDSNNDEMFNTQITKSRQVLQYIIDTLDKQYEVSGSLASLYEYMQYQIGRYSVTKKKEYAEEVIKMITELRDTFIEANKSISSKR